MVFIRVVFYPSGLSKEWSFIRLIICQGHISTGCQSSGWYFNSVSFIRVIFIMVVIHQDSLSAGCPRGHLHQGGHSSGWSLIRVVFLQGSIVYADTCTMTGGMIYLYNVWHIQASQKRRKPSGWASLRVDWCSLFMWRVRCSKKRRKPSRRISFRVDWCWLFTWRVCVMFRCSKKKRKPSRWISMRDAVAPNCSGWWLWLIPKHSKLWSSSVWVSRNILILVALSTCVIWCHFPVSSVMFLPSPPFLLSFCKKKIFNLVSVN